MAHPLVPADGGSIPASSSPARQERLVQDQELEVGRLVLTGTTGDVLSTKARTEPRAPSVVPRPGILTCVNILGRADPDSQIASRPGTRLDRAVNPLPVPAKGIGFLAVVRAASTYPSRSHGGDEAGLRAGFIIHALTRSHGGDEAGRLVPGRGPPAGATS